MEGGAMVYVQYTDLVASGMRQHRFRCTGGRGNNRLKQLRILGIESKAKEGEERGQWIVLDYWKRTMKGISQLRGEPRDRWIYRMLGNEGEGDRATDGEMMPSGWIMQGNRRWNIGEWGTAGSYVWNDKVLNGVWIDGRWSFEWVRL